MLMIRIWKQMLNFVHLVAKRMGREIVFVVFGQLVTVVGGIFVIRVFTGLLQPDVYGQIALVMTVASMVHLMVMAPLSQGCLRFYSPAREANELHLYFGAVQKLLLRCTLSVVFPCLFLAAIFCMFAKYGWLKLIAVIFIYSLLSSFNSLLDSIQNAARERAVVAWHQAASQWVRIIAVIIFVKLGGGSTVAVMLGQTAGIAAVLGSQVYFFLLKNRKYLKLDTTERNSDVEKWSSSIKTYSWPFAAWGVAGWVQSSSDRWSLQVFLSSTEVGLYSVLYQVGYSPIVLLTNMMMQLVTPIFFSRAGDGSNEKRLADVRKLNGFALLFALGLTFLATLAALPLHKWVFAVFVGAKYQSLSPLLPWVVLSGGLFATGQVASLLLMSGIHTDRLIVPKIGSAITALCLNLLGVFAFGIEGLVAATVAQSIIYLLWMLIVSRKATPVGIAC